VCHSEHNSNDLNLFSENFFTPVYFWSNAILSRYWYSHYKLLQKNIPDTTPKRFGSYIRDTTGTRKYRNELLRFLRENIPNDVFCPALRSLVSIPSDSSASIPWSEHQSFDIQIVPETLFNTEKTHLTEKVFKPIVMYQPFILFAGPNSLQYMRDYGFKTFGNIWDESYDLEIDANARFSKAVSLIKQISSLSKKEYKTLIEKTNNIVKFNRDHFYSEKFEKLLLSELHTNLDNALSIQEENFYKIPGGTLFYYHDLYYKITGKVPNPNDHKSPLLSNALQYANEKSPAVAKEIVRKYSHLL
jgi:hypothetical protein